MSKSANQHQDPSTPSNIVPGSIMHYNNIKKSEQDKRKYRGLKLPNGLKVVLVSDVDTDKAAAALSVDVGHLSDPDSLPGLAHFCEHMLFLGNAKYPDENAFRSFLSENGGSSNASTSEDTTKYYFDVVPSKLEDALDRFAQFFISPLFAESTTDREINAVNLEHEKNIANDLWRIYQINKLYSVYPHNKFGSGNKKTLSEDPLAQGIDVRSELMKFHEKWYSANIMSLSVYGKESLDTLEEMILSKFSSIVDKSVVTPKWTDPQYLAKDLATKVYIVPIKDSRQLIVRFQTSDLNQFYKSAPGHYLTHLIGHEGKGSILSELKSLGWSNTLLAAGSTLARGTGVFEIKMFLTTEGFDQINSIVKIIFQYINMLRKDEPKKWIFDEFCDLNEIQFRFKDNENPLSLVSNIIGSMQLYPLEEVLTAPYMPTEWKPDLIQNILNQLTPDKCRIIIVGQKNANIATSTEPLYGTKYHSEKIAETDLNEWREAGLNDRLHYPLPNPFIPTNFELLPAEIVESEQHTYPIIIRDVPVMRVWFKQDSKFLKPKTVMNFDFSTPIAYADPLNCNLTHMFVHLFKDQLNEYLYDAELAELRLGVTNTSSGISLSINGYSHKQQMLLEKILDQMFNFTFQEKRYELVKENLLKALNNFKTEQPYQLAFYYVELLMTERAWSKQELVNAVALITIEALQQYVKDFLSHMHVECVIYGNVTKQNALDLSALVEQKLRTTIIVPLLSKQLLNTREFKLEAGKRYLFEIENEFHKSTCTELYLQCGVQTDRSNVLIDLVAHIFKAPWYNTIRTKEQLGYVISSSTRKANSAQGLQLIVQSAKHPRFVEQRIESFLNGMLDTIISMTDDEFSEHKLALSTEKLETANSLVAQFNKYLKEISLQRYNFEKATDGVAILKSISKEEFIEYYKTYILSSGSERRTLSIHVTSKLDGNEASLDTQVDEVLGRSNDYTYITDLTTFKSSKELLAIVQPYQNVPPKGDKSYCGV